MSENEEKILCLCTNGSNDLERAAMPFVMANAALAMDVKAMIALQGEAVYLAKRGYVDTLPSPGGFEPLSKLIRDFMELGGELRVCVPCIKIRNIPESDLIDGAKTTAAGALNVEALNAKAVYTY
jgi:predicted peroxiredoxin